MSPLIRIIFLKEITDALRDKRAMQTMLVLVLLFPAMMWLMMGQAIKKATSSEHESVEVVVINAPAAPNLLRMLEQNSITIKQSDAMDEAQITALLAERKTAAVLRLSDSFSKDYKDLRPAEIEFWTDSAADLRDKVRKIETLLRRYNSGIAQTRLMVRGVSSALLQPINVQEYDTATQSSRAGKLAGALLGTIFIYVFYYCLNMVIDGTAGERERKSLEILLAQPARAVDVVAGKWLASATVSFAGLVIALIVGHLVLKQMPLEEIGMSWRLSFSDLVLLMLASLPLCLFAPAFEMALAVNSKTFKEAQAMVNFALVIPLIGAVVVPILDLTTKSWMYAVPVLAQQTLLSEFAKGNSLGALPYVLSMSVPLILTAIALSFASWRMKSERFIVGI